MSKIQKSELNANLFIYKESSVYGASQANHQKALEWFDWKIRKLPSFITRRFVFEETENAFIRSENKVGLKVVVLPGKTNKVL